MSNISLYALGHGPEAMTEFRVNLWLEIYGSGGGGGDETTPKNHR